MSAADSNNDRKTVGTIKIRRITNSHRRPDGDDFYRCTWDFKGKFTLDGKEELKSPLFVIPHRDECKWYLSIHTLYDGFDKGQIFCSTRLHLDRESECEAAVAKFKFRIDERKLDYSRSCSSRTFKFVTKSENSAAIFSIIPHRELQSPCTSDDDDDGNDDNDIKHYDQMVLCTMMIKKVIPENDSLSTDFGSLLKNNLFTDVVLTVGEKKFPAHKCNLSARSSVFAAMFAHNTTENNGVVDIKDVREEIVEEMLYFIYTGQVQKLDENLAQDLLIAADKYDLKGLIRKCEGVLIESLSNSNVFDLLLFAESYNASKLRLEAIYFIRSNKTELMKTSGWDNLNKSNPALVREISKARRRSESDSDTDLSYYSLSSDSDSE